MKCRNCGATSDGMTCPVCGHKQFKKAECSVCFTTLFPGQEYCPKCGSPTVYRKTDTVKRITPDTIVHSHESHNYNTVSESYDYKKDAYDYNEDHKKPNIMTFTSIFEPLKSNKYNYHRYQKPIKTSKKTVVPVSIIVLSIFIIICVVSTVLFVENISLESGIGIIFNDGSENVEGNTEFSDFIFDSDTTQNEYNHNIIDDGLSFVYNNQLYIADFDGIKVCESGEEPYLLIDDGDCSCLYVNENGVYYKNIEDNYIFDNGDENTTLLENVNKCYQLGNDIIHLDNDYKLFMYNIDTAQTTMLSQNVYDYVVDDVNHRILTFNNEGNEALIDFAGNILKDSFNKMISSYSSYFINGKIYFKDYEGIHCYDLMSDEIIDIYPDLDCYKFVVLEDDEHHALYTIDQSDYLNYVYLEDGEYVYRDICDNVESFYIIDDKVIFYTYDNDYNRVFYISDTEGNFARLQ